MGVDGLARFNDLPVDDMHKLNSHIFNSFTGQELFDLTEELYSDGWEATLNGDVDIFSDGLDIKFDVIKFDATSDEADKETLKTKMIDFLVDDKKKVTKVNTKKVIAFRDLSSNIEYEKNSFIDFADDRVIAYVYIPTDKI